MKGFNAAHEVQIEYPMPTDTSRAFFAWAGDTSDSLLYFGDENNHGELIAFSQPLPLFVFPLQVGKMWSGSSSATIGGVSDVPVHLTAKVDAFGTLILPTGSFPALRVSVIIDYTQYKQYRYYFLTKSPGIYCVASLNKTVNPDSDVQVVTVVKYADPFSKYDHVVAPNLSLGSAGSVSTSVGSFDTLSFSLLNKGDTDALVDSVYTLPNEKEIILFNAENHHRIHKQDSLPVSFVFHPTSAQNYFKEIIISEDGNNIRYDFEASGLHAGVVVPIADMPSLRSQFIQGRSYAVCDIWGREFRCLYDGVELRTEQLPKGMYLVQLQGTLLQIIK